MGQATERGRIFAHMAFQKVGDGWQSDRWEVTKDVGNAAEAMLIYYVHKESNVEGEIVLYIVASIFSLILRGQFFNLPATLREEGLLCDSAKMPE